MEIFATTAESYSSPGGGGKVERRTSANAGCRGTRGAGHGGPGAPGRSCRRLEAGTRAPATGTREPASPHNFLLRRPRGGCPSAPERSGEPGGRTHLRRSAPKRRAAAAAETSGAG